MTVYMEYPNIKEVSCNRLVPYYLMSCWLYYENDKNVLRDEDFDLLCKRINDEWDNITHVHKFLIDRQMLVAGSGYNIPYTNMIKGAAQDWYNEARKANIIHG